jgi:hypothetical protein
MKCLFPDSKNLQTVGLKTAFKLTRLVKNKQKNVRTRSAFVNICLVFYIQILVFCSGWAETAYRFQLFFFQ